MSESVLQQPDFSLSSKDQFLPKNSEPSSLDQWLERLSKSLPISMFILFAVNFLVYRNTLDGYFLADDFVHAAFLKQVFSGHPDLLVKNFYTTWMQTEGTQFYRPFISITLAFDYWLFGSCLNACGFHIANFLFQCFCSLALYLTTREVLRVAGRPQSFLPLVAGLLFSTHPLHPEVVSWIIARVDSVCCLFYLFAMFFFLKSRSASPLSDPEKLGLNRQDALPRPQPELEHSLPGSGAARVFKPFLSPTVWLCLSNTAFVLSLLSKEMAVTLPVTLTLYLVLFGAGSAGNGFKGLINGIVGALKSTWQPWLILVVYIIFRQIFLGSTGGYQGSIGESLSSSTFERIFSWLSIQKVIFPLNGEVFIPLKRWLQPLGIVYGAILILFVLRLARFGQRKTELKLVLFALLWFFTVMIPTIPVWNLTESLQGARFIYMGTAALCLLMALLAAPVPVSARESDAAFIPLASPEAEAAPSPFPSPTTSHAARPVFVGARFYNGSSALASISLIILFGLIAFQNNNVWDRAGAELKALRQSLEDAVARLPSGHRLALLNLPHRYRGAHMLYNAATLTVLLEPPLSPTKIYDRVLTFEPPLYGEEDLIRISRVRQILNSKKDNHFFFWDREAWKLKPLNLCLDTKESMLGETGYDLTAIDIDGRGNGDYKQAGTAHGAALLSDGHALNENSMLITPAIDVPTGGIDFLDICLVASFNGSEARNVIRSGSTSNPSVANAEGVTNRPRVTEATVPAGRVNATGPAKMIPVVMEWNSLTDPRFDNAESLVFSFPADGVARRVRLHVSEHKKWLKSGIVHRLGFWSPESNLGIKVLGVSTRSGDNAIASLSPDALHFPEDESGIARTGAYGGSFDYDVSRVNGAAAALFEISKPDAWFEHYSNTYRDKQPCQKALQTWRSKTLSWRGATFEIKKDRRPGFYELRVAALGSDGQVAGYFSDPIMFQIGR